MHSLPQKRKVAEALALLLMVVVGDRLLECSFSNFVAAYLKGGQDQGQGQGQGQGEGEGS